MGAQGGLCQGADADPGARLRPAPLYASHLLCRRQRLGVHGLSRRDHSVLGDELEVREGIMNIIRLALAAALIGLSALATPSFAGKKDNSIRFATDVVLNNFDSYFNTSQIGI